MKATAACFKIGAQMLHDTYDVMKAMPKHVVKP